MFRSATRQTSRPPLITWMMSGLPSLFTSIFCAEDELWGTVKPPATRSLPGRYLGLLARCPFYDAGGCFLGRHSQGGTAHAVGLGLRFDVNWLSLLERTTLRFDVAKTVNETTPPQFWFGIQHPF